MRVRRKRDPVEDPTEMMWRDILEEARRLAQEIDQASDRLSKVLDREPQEGEEQ